MVEKTIELTGISANSVQEAVERAVGVMAERLWQRAP